MSIYTQKKHHLKGRQLTIESTNMGQLVKGVVVREKERLRTPLVRTLHWPSGDGGGLVFGE